MIDVGLCVCVCVRELLILVLASCSSNSVACKLTEDLGRPADYKTLRHSLFSRCMHAWLFVTHTINYRKRP